MRPKSLAILLVFIMGAVAVRAQIVITTPYEFSYGVSAGTTFSSFTFNPKVQQATLVGLTIGLTGRLSMGENVGLQAELNFSQQGWKEDFEDTPEYKYSRRLNYLQLPLYTHIQFGGKKVKGFLNAGPQIGYMISESTDQNLNGAEPGRVNYQHTLPTEKKFEWGISGGAGIEVRTGIGYFLIEGRYLYSLGDIYSTTSSDLFAKASGQTITAKLTYLIPWKKNR